MSQRQLAFGAALPEHGEGLRFYLGAHQPAWLSRTDVPLFVSAVRLRGRRRLPRATCRWALDSGGFSALRAHGRWTVSAAQYAREVRRYRDEIGGLDWAATQDWMCEPQILARTGLSIAEHQRRTVDSYSELLALAPDLPWTPVLQGWTLGHYLDCAELYEHAGVALAELPVVGVGTLCRRQHALGAQAILQHLAADGLRMHAFGLKLAGLRGLAALSDLHWSGDGGVVSADSMAWSYRARRAGHGDQNSLPYALAWRGQVVGG